jgi:hypothetical protein
MRGSPSTGDALLTPVPGQLRAIDAALVPIRDANGMWLAADLVTPDAIPAHAIALRQGFAVTPSISRAPPCMRQCCSGLHHGQPKPGFRDAGVDRPTHESRAAGWLQEPAALAQRGGCKRRTRPRGLGGAVRPVADALGLGFIPVAEEHYDFAVEKAFCSGDPGRAFTSALAASTQRLRQLGFEPGMSAFRQAQSRPQ